MSGNEEESYRSAQGANTVPLAMFDRMKLGRVRFGDNASYDADDDNGNESGNTLPLDGSMAC